MSRALWWIVAAGAVVASCAATDGFGTAVDDPPPSPIADDSQVTDPISSASDGAALADDEPESTSQDDRAEDTDLAVSPLTGREIDQDRLQAPPLQVKIENSPKSRPQAGLDQADVVYEELVEGGVTRFFTVFHSEMPESVGPVRSARPVDVQLMGGYGRAGFVYSGARGEVQELLSAAPSIRISEGHTSLFREPSRSAPHNLYLDVELANDAVASRDPDLMGETGWQFNEDVPDGAVACEAPCDRDPGESIDIAMSYDYTTGWEYDEEAGVYARLQNGQPFDAAGDGDIGAANVVVLETHHYVSESGYPETDLITDDAAALVLRDGQRYEARWQKPSVDAPITVTDADGEPFEFKPGSTWVHLPDSL